VRRRPWVEDLEGRALLTTITEVPGVIAADAPLGIVTGPDNNLWFTEFQGTKVGKITTGGAVTEFSNGITAASRPLAIANDGLGHLWFTEFNASQIGEVDPTTGAVTEFSNGITQDSSPVGIAADGSGNLWFTEFFADQIGRITPSGVVTEFSAGITPGSNPAGIVAGPDGALWFTEFAGSRIGRIDPNTGAVTEFPTGVPPGTNPIPPGAGPGDITVGPDGALWFTQYRDGEVGRLDPQTGAVTEFSAGISPNAFPAGITLGPDNKLWFAEEGTGKFGVITPSAVQTPTTTSLGASPSSPTIGQTVSFTAAVFAGGQFVPGTVTFTVDGVAEPPVPLHDVTNVTPELDHSEATLPVPNFGPGKHTVTAHYDGTAAFAPSDSNPSTVDVARVTTKAVLNSAPNPSTAGQTVTFTVNLSESAPTATSVHVRQAIPFAGTVVFVDNGTKLLGQAQVSTAGLATFQVVIQTPGTHVVTAVYSGDPVHAPVVSNAVRQQVLPATAPPHVTGVFRFGVHWDPTTLVLTFDRPLNPLTAQFTRN
jgi:streptogramin lyase